MLEIKTYDLGYCEESEYTRVVCVSRYKDKFVSGMVSGIIMSVFHIALGAIGIPLAMQNDDIYIQNMEYLNELEYLDD